MKKITDITPTRSSYATKFLKSGSIFVHLNPKAPNSGGLTIPARLMNQPQVVLQFGYDMPVPIDDLSVDDDGISGTLSFRGLPFWCYVPWTCVFAVVNEAANGQVWKEVIPESVARALVPKRLTPVDDDAPRATVTNLDAYRDRKRWSGE